MLHRILMLTILATGTIVDSGVFPPYPLWRMLQIH